MLFEGKITGDNTFSNRITELFGIKYPIIQAGMIWASGWKLASAVSNAGGLGPREVAVLSRLTEPMPVAQALTSRLEAAALASASMGGMVCRA